MPKPGRGWNYESTRPPSEILLKTAMDAFRAISEIAAATEFVVGDEVACIFPAIPVFAGTTSWPVVGTCKYFEPFSNDVAYCCSRRSA